MYRIIIKIQYRQWPTETADEPRARKNLLLMQFPKLYIIFSLPKNL